MPQYLIKASRGGLEFAQTVDAPDWKTARALFEQDNPDDEILTIRRVFDHEPRHDQPDEGD